MRRWVPFAIAVFMLLPFALWGGFWLSGLRGTANGLTSPEGVVLFLASLPLAGVFFLQNLRQMGDSMGRASAARRAERLARLLPLAILLLTLLGLAWLWGQGTGLPPLAVVGAGGAAMALLGWRAAGLRAAPRRAAPPAPARVPDGEAAAWFLCNLLAVLGLLAWFWTPMVLLWAALAAVPLAFAGMIGLAWWASREGGAARSSGHA